MKNKLLILALAIVVIAAGWMIFVSKKGSGQPKTGNAVYISSVTPVSGPIGTTVTLTGSGFDEKNNDLGFSYVSSESGQEVIGYTNNVASTDGSVISFELPEAVGVCAASTAKMDTGCPAIAQILPKGSIQLFVVNKTGTSNKVGFVIN